MLVQEYLSIGVNYGQTLPGEAGNKNDSNYVAYYEVNLLIRTQCGVVHRMNSKKRSDFT